MLSNVKDILFIDIETVSVFKHFDDLPERFKPLWQKKAGHLQMDNIPANESFFQKAAIYAEFGKIIVIGVGYISYDANQKPYLKIKAIHGHNEFELLQEFCQLINKISQKQSLKLCAHNGKEFDFPYLCRRLIINNLPLPKVLDVRELKPWDIPHYDTMEMWRFGDKKAYTSLELLAACLNVPTSKTLLEGSKVNHTYYLENNLDAIAEYCKQDVATLANIFLKLTGQPIIPEPHIIYQ